MLRSELIKILEDITRECQRDGEVLIEIIKDRQNEDGLLYVNPWYPVADIGEALGNGEAISVIRIMGND